MLSNDTLGQYTLLASCIPYLSHICNSIMLLSSFERNKVLWTHMVLDPNHRKVIHELPPKTERSWRVHKLILQNSCLK